ncbi:hypothetical protein J2T13_003114 [Paenibacillus sp. DS2015]|uniref:hypothetical protein n=1 Tax=Paenibacillus sp. DS2015 TaxID=3373917 RepID=UPI003D1B3450
MALPLSRLDVSPELTSTKPLPGDQGSIAIAVIMHWYSQFIPDWLGIVHTVMESDSSTMPPFS